VQGCIQRGRGGGLVASAALRINGPGNGSYYKAQDKEIKENL
jgi:hypothetical protein